MFLCHMMRLVYILVIPHLGESCMLEGISIMYGIDNSVSQHESIFTWEG